LNKRLFAARICILGFLGSGVVALAFAQDGKLEVRVPPQESDLWTTSAKFSLKPVSGNVSGPLCCVPKEASSDSVLHKVMFGGFSFGAYRDDFNSDIVLERKLLVSPGTNQVNLLERNGEAWSGYVTVAGKKRVIKSTEQVSGKRRWSFGRAVKSIFRLGGSTPGYSAPGSPFACNPRLHSNPYECQ
jgi:hypothetical protein